MDRGAAILGSNRADLFYGREKKAEKIAGVIKKKLLIYLLVPKEKKMSNDDWENFKKDVTPISQKSSLRKFKKEANSNFKNKGKKNRLSI